MNLKNFLNSKLPDPGSIQRCKEKIMRLSLCFLFVTFFTLPQILFAQTWDGGGDGTSWNDPLNWDNNVTPTATDDVVIDLPMVSITIPVTVPAIRSLRINSMLGSLTISSGALLTIDGSGGPAFGLRVQGTGFIMTTNNGGLLQIQNITGAGINNIDAVNFVNNGSIALLNTTSMGMLNQITGGNGIQNISGTGTLDIDNVATATGHAILNRIEGNTTFMATLNFSMGNIDINSVGTNDGIRNFIATNVNQSTINFGLTNPVGTLEITGAGRDGISNEISATSVNANQINFGPMIGAMTIENSGASGIRNQAFNDGVINFINSNPITINNAGTFGILNNANNTSQVSFINNSTIDIDGTTDDGIQNNGAGTASFTNSAMQQITIANVGGAAIDNRNTNTFLNGNCAAIETSNTNSGLVQVGGANFENDGLFTLDNAINDATAAGTFDNTAGRVVVPGGTASGFTGAIPNPDGAPNDSDGVVDGIAASLAETAPLQIVANAAAFADPVTVCEGTNNLTLSILNDPGTGTYLWSDGSTSATTTVNTLPANSGIYSVTITDATGGPGCMNFEAQINVVINPAPPAIALGGNSTLTICEEEPAGTGRRVITSDADPLITNVSWTLTSSPIAGVLTDFFSIVGPNNRTAEALTTAPAGTYQLEANTESAAACTSLTPALFTVTINASPTGTIAAVAPTICEDTDDVILSFTATTGTGPFSIVVTSDDDSNNTFSNANNITVTQNTSGTPLMSGDQFSILRVALEGGGGADDYEVRLISITDNNTCESTGIDQDVAVRVNPDLIGATIMPVTAEACEDGGTVQLTVSTVDFGAGAAAPPGGTTFSWSTDLPAAGGFDNSVIANPVFTAVAGSGPATVTATVMITDADGICSSSFDRTITIYDDVTPTAFTIDTCTSGSGSYNLTIHNSTVTGGGVGTVQWFAGDPDNGGTAINTGAITPNEEETFDLATFIGGGGTLYANIVNGPCREAIPTTVNFTNPQGTINVASSFCAAGDSVALDFSTAQAGNFMINLSFDENDGGGFSAASGNPYLVTNGSQVKLLATTDYDEAAVLANSNRNLSIQLTRIEAANGCFVDGLTQTVSTVIDPDPIVELLRDGTVAASGTTATICNGSDAEFALRLTGANPDNLIAEYFVQSAVMNQMGSIDLTGVWQSGMTYPASASPYPSTTSIPTPVLTNNEVSGSITYTVIPQTASGCEAAAITFTIQLEETPDLFILEGITEDTLCDGTAPTLTLGTRFFPIDDIEFEILMIDDDSGDGDDGVLHNLNVGDVIDGAAIVYDPINNYSTALIPDVLTNGDADGDAGDNYVAQTIHYQIAVNKKNPPGPICGVPNTIDLYFTVLPDAFDLMTFMNNDTEICSGESSDISIELTPDGNEFVGPVEGGAHKIQLLITPMNTVSPANPATLMTPASATILFGNDPDGADNIAGNTDDEVLSFNISDLLTNQSGQYGELSYNIEATLITPDGRTMCTMVLTTETVRVFPEPVLTAGSLTEICSGDTLTISDLINENPISDMTGSPALQPVTADWMITNLPAGVTAAGSSGTEQITPVMTTATTILTNTTNSPQTVRFSFTPENNQNCSGATLMLDLVVNPLPQAAISFAAGNESICSGEDIELDFTTTAGELPLTVIIGLDPINPDDGNTTYDNLTAIMVSNPASGITISPADLPISLQSFIGELGIRLVSVSDANGCVNNINDDVSLTINEIPVLTSVGPRRRCMDDTRPIFINVTGGSGNYTYAWTPAAAFTDPTVEDPTFNASVQPGTYPLTVAVTDAQSACTATASFDMIIEGLPDVTQTNTASTLCEGETISLTFTENMDAGLPFSASATIDDGVNPPTVKTLNGLTDMGTIDFVEGTDFTGSATISNIEISFDNPPTNCTRTYADIAVTVISDPVTTATYTTPSASGGTICSGTSVAVALSSTAMGVEGTDYEFQLVDIRFDNTGDGVIDGTGGYPTGVSGNLFVGQTLTTVQGLTDQLTNSTAADVLIRYQLITRLLNVPNCEGAILNVTVIVKPMAPTPTLTLNIDGNASPLTGSVVCLGTTAELIFTNPDAPQMIFHAVVDNPNEVAGAGNFVSGTYTEADGLIIPGNAGPFSTGVFALVNAGTISGTITPYPDANANGTLEADEQACPGPVIALNLTVVPDPDIALTYNNNPTASFGEICSGSQLDVGLSSTTTGTEGTDYEFVIMNIRHDDGLSGDLDINTPSGAANGYGPVNGGLTIGDVLSGGLTEMLTNTLATDVRISYQVKTRLISAPNCEGPDRWINVVVNGALSASITDPGPICVQAAPFNLSATPPGGDFMGVGITNTSNGTFNPDIAGVGNHNITYSITDAGGCTATTSIMINVGPDISLQPAGPVCVDASSFLLQSSPLGGTFGGPGVNATTGEFDPASAGTGLHTITYTFTDANSCTGTVSIMITVGPVINPTIDPAGPFCINAMPATLGAMPSGGTFSGTGITNGSTGEFTSSVAGNGTHTISYSVMMSGCMATTTRMITVTDLPVITFGPVPPVCVDNSAITLTVNPTGGNFTGVGITNTSMGRFNPSVAGVGIHTITYTVTDANGCTNSATLDINVPECLDPVITNDIPTDPSISDPCLCIGNGQFSEEIVVISNPGETWTVSSNTGLLRPGILLPYTVGTALTEVMVSFDTSYYVINGIHRDGLGYTISVESPQHSTIDPPLTVANTCYYPEVELLDVNNAYCSDATGITFTGSAGGVAGVGSFSVAGLPPLTTTQIAGTDIWTTTVNASPLGVGRYNVTFSFDAGTAGSNDPSDPGCVETVSQSFQLVNSAGAIACNDTVNLSLDNLCMADIPADFVLEGTYNLDIFQVIIYDSNNDTLQGPIDASYVGQYLTASVIDTCSGNSCWGVLFIEDKFPPVLFCGRDTIDCDEDSSPTALGLPIPPTAVATLQGANSWLVSGIDSCGAVSLTFTDTETANTCNGDFASKIYRSWTAVDGYGNTVSCNDTICIRRGTLATASLPENFDNITNPAFVCSDTWPMTAEGYPSPDTTGRPGASGCYNIQYAFDDTEIPDCQGGYKVLREWTILDWCQGGVRFHNQVIKVMDNIAPTITCLADTTISASFGNCTGGLILPLPVVSDNCSTNNTITATASGGNLVRNGNQYFFTDLMIGTYTITFTVTDDCGNPATCMMDVTVADLIPPNPVCDSITVAGLNVDGTTRVMASTYDDGSNDDCGDVFFKARRMIVGGCNGLNGDDDLSTPLTNEEWFDDDVIFCCDDAVGAPVRVIFRVYDVDPGVGPVDPGREQPGGDLHNRFNDCMIVVTVQNNLAVNLTCPPDITVSCEFNYDINNLSAIFGTIVGDPKLQEPIIIGDPGNPNPPVGNNWGIDGVVSSSCGGMVTETVTPMLNQCGVGTIERTFGAVGSPSSCTQIITITDFDPLTANDIVFPSDTTLTGCGNNNTVSSITGRPIYPNGACTMATDTFTEESFVFDTACLKIFRYWVVLDWCTFDQATGAGIYRDTQVIKVLDDVNPMITRGCADTTLCVDGGTCTLTTTLTAEGSDDCTPDSLLRWTWSLDFDNNGIFDGAGTGPAVNATFPIGTHRILWRVEDGCNNADFCEQIITTEDCGSVSFLCVAGTLNIQLPFRSGNQIDVNANQFSGNFNISGGGCSGGSIDFSFSSDLNDTLRTVTCLEVLNGPITLTVFAFDSNGNLLGSCPVMVDLTGCDIAQPLVISGSVRDEESQSMNEVMVKLDGGMNMEDRTNDDGLFEFPDLPGGYNYSVAPEKDTRPRNGVTTFDIVTMSKHILGVEALNSPYKMIAADVNKSGTITTLDMLELRRLILFIDNEFRSNTSWRFVDADYVFPDPGNPFDNTFPEVYFANGLDENTAIRFTAIKVGDLNSSAEPDDQLIGSEDRQANRTLSFGISDQTIVAGQDYNIEFKAQDFKEILGYQLTLQFDQTALEFVSASNGDLPEWSLANLGMRFIDRGILTSSWSRSQVLSLADEQVLFSLRFRATADGQLSELLELSPDFLTAEAYSDLEGLQDLALNFQKARPLSFVLNQNRPNPFRSSTVISFELPKASAASLTIYDVSGRTLKVYTGEFVRGYNEITINHSELPHAGVLYYQLETAEHTATRKMTVLD